MWAIFVVVVIIVDDDDDDDDIGGRQRHVSGNGSFACPLCRVLF